MLLIDGVRYEEWIPEKEVEEFHPIIKEHIKDIFGRQSFFIEGTLLRTEAGKGSVPDGFILVFSKTPQWHILEVELSTHSLYDHIVNQVGRFINGISNPSMQRFITDAIYKALVNNKVNKAEIEEAIGSGEIYKCVSDVVSKPPILTIIIERKTKELEEAINLLKYTPIKVIEFKTFNRENVGLSVHAHLFEPLYKTIIRGSPDIPPVLIANQTLEKNLGRSEIAQYYLYTPVAAKDLFPQTETNVELITDIGAIEVKYYVSKYGDGFGKGMVKWFKAHHELKEGDKIRISVVESTKKYRIEIVK
ncbi:MAG: hypothetical protein PHR56_01455 [Dehalococcoidales bacterium]|nr:hypothetical protein [Dehalococcoidales bacterium]